MKNTLIAALAAAALTGATNTAFAADYISSDNKRIERGWYVTGAVSAEAYAIDLDNAALDNVVANTLYGIGGTVEACKAGIGSISWLDLCAGGHAFKSLGTAEEHIHAGLGGGISEIDMTTFGAFIKARAHVGYLTISPYAGLRRMQGDLSLAGLTENYSANALFAGSELGLALFGDRGELGLRGEMGKTTGDVDFNGTSTSDGFTYYSGAAFLRVKF